MGFVERLHLFWEVAHGRWESILGNSRGITRIMSLIPLFVLFSYGLFGFLNGIFNSMPWYYNMTFAISSIAVAQGFMPLINYLDEASPNQRH